MQRIRDWVSNDDLKALGATGLIVAGLLIVSWLAREVLGLWHGEFLTALLILTVIVFLITSGRLKPVELSLGGVSVRVLRKELKETARQLQQEQERLIYLGKLEQALKKSTGKKENLCLLYADIDGLRETTWAEKTNNMERRELDIRNEIRTKLAVCLEDAFFERAKKGDKFDLFELGEPDIIIMTRGIKRETARKIAEAGKNSFESSVTIALLCDKEIRVQEPTASELDKEAEKRLNEAKEHYRFRGTVYPPNIES